MNIIIIEKNDKIQIKNDLITFLVHKHKYSYFLSEIDKATLLLNDVKNEGDDISLLLRIGDNTFIVPSTHKDFEDFLLNNLCIYLQIDMSKVTEAFSCTDKAEFVIYER